MSETTWATLRQVLAERYDEFRHRLTRRLGSDERARETLHETWLHLHGRGGPGAVRSPAGYLLRAALNLATDRDRRELRRAARFEVGPMLDMADDAPGSDREVEARQQIAFLEQVLEELPARQRMILLASRLEGIPLARPRHALPSAVQATPQTAPARRDRWDRAAPARAGGEGRGPCRRQPCRGGSRRRGWPRRLASGSGPCAAPSSTNVA